MSLDWRGRLAAECVPFASIFTSFWDFDFRDGNLGLTDPDLRLEAAAGGSAPQMEGLMKGGSTSPYGPNIPG
jgi:hypothetical protein